jgi:hypothetical protein
VKLTTLAPYTVCCIMVCIKGGAVKCLAAPYCAVVCCALTCFVAPVLRCALCILQGKIKGSYTADKMIEFCRRGTLGGAQLVLGLDRNLPYNARQASPIPHLLFTHPIHNHAFLRCYR